LVARDKNVLRRSQGGYVGERQPTPGFVIGDAHRGALKKRWNSEQKELTNVLKQKYVYERGPLFRGFHQP
jgi:hypothetical protein